MQQAHQTDLRTFAWTSAPVLDACPVQSDHGQLLVLTADGALHGFDFDTGRDVRHCAVELPELPRREGNALFGAPAYRLHATADGSHAAIVVDKGRDGIVVQVASGTVTMRLEGGDYHDNTVPFSACFVRHEGRNVLVHRTRWNRLDATDPATGASLTERNFAPRRSGKRPNHDLDYFHGLLRPSPGDTLLFDDGWVWHPLSVPRVWSVAQWLGANPWESEDGASVVSLTQRDDWMTPACWIGEQRVALWGVADWDDEGFEETGKGPGVRIFDVTGKSPSEPWPMEQPAGRVLELFCDGECVFVAAESGTTAWDIASRRKVADVPGFIARRHDRARNALVGFDTNEIVELPLPIRGC